MSGFLLCLFGIFVGMLSGLLGIGGGVALVPGLILLFGFTQREAQGTSLAVLSLPILIFAAFEYYRCGDMRLPVVGWIALGFVFGAYTGARWLLPIMPQEVLRLVFGAILLYVGFLFVWTPGAQRPGAALPAALATIFTVVLGWVLRRKRTAKPPHGPPPEGDVEYHI